MPSPRIVRGTMVAQRYGIGGKPWTTNVGRNGQRDWKLSEARAPFEGAGAAGPFAVPSAYGPLERRRRERGRLSRGRAASLSWRRKKNAEQEEATRLPPKIQRATMTRVVWNCE